MKEYYCFDITFPNIDFDSHMANAEKIKVCHHVHLYSTKNEIELKFFFESNTYFGTKLSLWASQINWKMFGSFLQTSNENQNVRLQKIDFTNASLLGVTTSTSQYEGDFEYVIIKIDCVKFYWTPSIENVNTAEFYLNEAGFKVLKDFYAPLFGDDGKFNISRMNGMDVFYTLENTEFRPEFNFCSSDNKSNNEAIIMKEPKIQFLYKDNITETEAIKYADLIRTIASFYFHSPIDYTLSRIHLEKHTITIKRIQKKSVLDSSGNFWGFKNFWNFHKLMNSNWQKSALDNYDILIIVVSRFIHAQNVYDTSKFLIYYSIVEHLKAMSNEINSEFSFIGTKKARNTKCNEAVSLLLDIVPYNEHDEFKIRLNSLRNDLKYRPMKRPLEEFLLKNKINLNGCSIDLKKLVEIRNSLIHGNSETVNYDELDKANILLYRITGILILQLMGVNEWELDLKLE